MIGNPCVRILLRECPAPGDLTALAAAARWGAAQFVPQSETSVASLVWTTPAGVVQFSADQFRRLEYFVVRHDLAAVVLIRKHFAAIGTDETLAIWEGATGPVAQARSIHALGIAAPPHYQPEVASVIGRALEDTSPAVRGAALAALLYVSWRELIPALRRAALSETDPGLASDMRHALDAAAPAMLA
jgi:hypothetical protein